MLNDRLHYAINNEDSARKPLRGPLLIPIFITDAFFGEKF